MKSVISKNVFYAVLFGRNPGVYTNAKECFDQIIDFAGAEVRVFGTKERAKMYLRNDNVFQVGKDANLSTSNPEERQVRDLTKRQEKEQEDDTMQQRTKVNNLSGTLYGKSGYFAVRDGRKPDIYTDAEFRQIQFTGLNEVDFAHCKTLEEAKKSYRNVEQRFYAVKEGFQPGIYTSRHEFGEQMLGYKKPIGKGFKTREEAEDFMKRIPDSNISLASRISPKVEFIEQISNSNKQTQNIPLASRISPKVNLVERISNPNKQIRNIPLASRISSNFQNPFIFKHSNTKFYPFPNISRIFNNFSSSSNSKNDSQLKNSLSRSISTTSSTFIPTQESSKPSTESTSEGNYKKRKAKEEDLELEIKRTCSRTGTLPVLRELTNQRHYYHHSPCSNFITN